MFNNETFILTTHIIENKSYENKNPIDSWYVGGILFMLTVILVLLYANYYRENAFQILWRQLLTKLHIIRPPSQRISSTSLPPINTLLI